jgi:hypothetical protein
VSLGPNHRRVAETLTDLGYLELKRGHLEPAAAYLRRAASIRIAYGETGLTFYNLVSVAWSLSIEQPKRREELTNESFEASQMAMGDDAAVAISNMAARFAVDTSALAAKVRQLLSEHWPSAFQVPLRPITLPTLARRG